MTKNLITIKNKIQEQINIMEQELDFIVKPEDKIEARGIYIDSLYKLHKVLSFDDMTNYNNDFDKESIKEDIAKETKEIEPDNIDENDDLEESSEDVTDKMFGPDTTDEEIYDNQETEEEETVDNETEEELEEKSGNEISEDIMEQLNEYEIEPDDYLETIRRTGITETSDYDMVILTYAINDNDFETLRDSVLSFVEQEDREFEDIYKYLNEYINEDNIHGFLSTIYNL